MSAVNGANGHAVPTPTTDEEPISLMVKLASYKTALLAILAMVKRDGNEWRSPKDQMLIREVERLLLDGENKPEEPEKKCDKK